MVNTTASGSRFRAPLGKVDGYNAANPSDLIANLAYYYKLDGNANDERGALNLTEVNSPSYSSSTKIQGQSIQFTPASSKEHLSSSNVTINLGTAYTIHLWLYWDGNSIYYENSAGSGATTGGNILGQFDYKANGTSCTGNGDKFWGIYVETSTGVIAFYIHTGGCNTGTILTYSSAASTLVASTWYHIVMRHDGAGNFSMFVNNASAVTAATHPQSSASWTRPLYIGSGGYFYYSGTYPNNITRWYWSGYFDEVGIWNRKLTDTEVATLYNVGIGTRYPFGSESYGYRSGRRLGQVDDVNK